MSNSTRQATRDAAALAAVCSVKEAAELLGVSSARVGVFIKEGA